MPSTVQAPSKFTPFGPVKDQQFMSQALKAAKKAYALDEVPVGAVVVNSAGTIVARGYNKSEVKATQAAHAEMQALTQAGKKLKDWRLNDHWLYVTLEPCAMCLGLAQISRIAGVIFGAPSPLFGSCLDKDGGHKLYKRDVLTVVSDVDAEACAQLLREFFKQKRNKRG